MFFIQVNARTNHFWKETSFCRGKLRSYTDPFDPGWKISRCLCRWCSETCKSLKHIKTCVHCSCSFEKCRFPSLIEITPKKSSDTTGESNLNYPACETNPNLSKWKGFFTAKKGSSRWSPVRICIPNTIVLQYDICWYILWHVSFVRCSS